MLLLKLVFSVFFNAALFALLLFLPAPTLDWWRAWVLVAGAFAGTTGVLAGLSRGHDGLLKERLKPPIQKGQPLADKILLIVYLAAFSGVFVFIPVDVFRLHLMSKPGTLISSSGLVLSIVGWYIAYLALRQNAFAALVVKHQPERLQTVVDTGVYSVVRHPLYAGGSLMIIGVALWLESYPAALLAVVPMATVALRIVFEERFLKRELQGYEAYTGKVRYRLVPFLW